MIVFWLVLKIVLFADPFCFRRLERPLFLKYFVIQTSSVKFSAFWFSLLESGLLFCVIFIAYLFILKINVDLVRFSSFESDFLFLFSCVSFSSVQASLVFHSLLFCHPF